MLKAWFKGCLAEILALMDCLGSGKTTLNVVLWPGCVNCVICPKKCLGAVWIKNINPNC